MHKILLQIIIQGRLLSLNILNGCAKPDKIAERMRLLILGVRVLSIFQAIAFEIWVEISQI